MTEVDKHPVMYFAFAVFNLTMIGLLIFFGVIAAGQAWHGHIPPLGYPVGGAWLAIYGLGRKL